MKIKKEKITTLDNQQVFKITFTNNNNYVVNFYNFGGYIDSISIPYKNKLHEYEDVLLGYRNFENYILDKSYLNCIIGRVCGRISNAKFDLNNKTYQLFSNNGQHHIHGGQFGFNKKVWHINSLNKNSDEISCILYYKSLHLEEGYPGTVECITKYILNNKNEFIIEFYATTDSDTIINLTNHNYWNFHGHNSYYQNIKDHIVKINARYYCESDNNLIPTGKLLNVENTKLNFFDYTKINQDILRDNGIDTCYCVSDNAFLDLINLDKRKLREVATVFSNLTKMGIVMYSNKPCLQFYTGNMMHESYNGKYGKKYGRQYGLCLESQFFPDSMNCKNFVIPILQKGKTYNSTIIIKLKNDF